MIFDFYAAGLAADFSEVLLASVAGFDSLLAEPFDELEESLDDVFDASLDEDAAGLSPLVFDASDESLEVLFFA